jgi:hypothetical protein
MVPLQQESASGPVVFGLRPHPALWLPVRRPESPEKGWWRHWGKVEFLLRPDPRWGIPFGQDRLMLILLITAAVKQQSRRVRLPSAFQILRLFGLPPSGRNYARLAERLARVRSVKFTVSIDSVTVSDRICEDAALWFDSVADNTDQNENTATLSETVWISLRQNALPLELPVVQALTDSPSTLDFYTWLAARAYAVRPDRYAEISLFGSSGLSQLMGVPGNPRDFRKRVRAWLRQLRDCWKVCPAVLADGKDTLMVCRVQPPRVSGL